MGLEGAWKGVICGEDANDHIWTLYFDCVWLKSYAKVRHACRDRPDDPCSSTSMATGQAEHSLAELQVELAVREELTCFELWSWNVQPFLGGGFKYSLFSSLPGEMIQFD